MIGLHIAGLEEGSDLPMWTLVVSGETFEEAVENARQAMERHGLGQSDSRPSLGQGVTDPVQQFIRSLPEDCRTSFHCLDVLGMFRITAQNVFQMDTPHRREAIIREIRKREHGPLSF